MSIIDATGRDVGRPRSMENGSRTVDVSGLAPGAYIACLRSGRIVVSKRFLRLP
ncbi:MAG: T9SS type A sorting domain-containing protein [Flavobacteriales bacterium]|nr:T9SS type A sorting domain-containing protein [Flavobacteriales bacterium]